MVAPVVLVRLTAPAVAPVTVIEPNVLVLMLVPVASRPLAPLVVIVVEPKSVVPALLSSTPVEPVLTDRPVMLNVPELPLSSRPGCEPPLPTFTSSIVPPLSPAPPKMPPPVPDGARSKPRTSLPLLRSITSALVAVSVGRAPGLAASSDSLPSGPPLPSGSTVRPSCSPISRSPEFIA